MCPKLYTSYDQIVVVGRAKPAALDVRAFGVTSLLLGGMCYLTQDTNFLLSLLHLIDWLRHLLLGL